MPAQPITKPIGIGCALILDKNKKPKVKFLRSTLGFSLQNKIFIAAEQNPARVYRRFARKLAR